MKVHLNDLKTLLKKEGYEVVDIKEKVNQLACEIEQKEVDIIKDVFKNSLSMITLDKMVNIVKSCRYCVENDIPGDFVECGVWRGGSGIIARRVFDNMNSNKKVYMYDTFAGMTKPTEDDISILTKRKAINKYNASLKDTHNDWCYASL